MKKGEYLMEAWKRNENEEDSFFFFYLILE
jgi:hypothetical protein